MIRKGSFVKALEIAVPNCEPDKRPGCPVFAAELPWRSG
jgi:hypothetical protein